MPLKTNPHCIMTQAASWSSADGPRPFECRHRVTKGVPGCWRFLCFAVTAGRSLIIIDSMCNGQNLESLNHPILNNLLRSWKQTDGQKARVGDLRGRAARQLLGQDQEGHRAPSSSAPDRQMKAPEATNSATDGTAFVETDDAPRSHGQVSKPR